MFQTYIPRLAAACSFIVFLVLYVLSCLAIEPTAHAETLTRSLYNNYSSPQKFAYVGALSLLVCMAVVAAWIRQKRFAAVAGLARRVKPLFAQCQPPLLLAAVMVCGVITHSGVGRDQYLLGLGLGFLGLVIAARAGVAVTRSTGARIAWGLSLVLFIGVLTIPGFFGSFIVPDIRLSFEEHYGSPFSGAVRLFAGLQLFTEVTPYYGLFSNFLVAGLQKILGPFSAGDFIRLIQSLQCIFILASLLLYKKIGFRSIFLVLLAMAFWAPWISTSSASILAPNSSAYRFVFFPAAVAALLAARGRPLPAVVGLGVLAAAAVLYNTETGIAVSFGLLFFTLLKVSHRTLGCVVGHGLAFFAAMALGAAALLVPVAIIYGIDFYAFGACFVQLSMFASGLEGKSLLADPLALLIFVHAMTLVFRAGVALFSRQETGAKLQIHAALAMILLIWGMYYINRPHNGNLWSYKYLYSFLLPCWFNVRAGRSLMAWVRRPRLTKRIDIAVVIVMVILVPSMSDATLNELKNIARSCVARSEAERSTADPQRLSRYSGVLMPRGCADDLAAKTEYLRGLSPAERDGVFLVARNFFTLANETGVHNPEPFIDLFFNSYAKDSLLRNFGAMMAKRHPLILMDDVEASACPRQHEAYPRFREWLTQGISGAYTQTGQQSGWVIYRRNGK